MQDYMNFILDRAKGLKISGARYIRNFVMNHKLYENDSIVSNNICYDLMADIVEINLNNEKLQKYLGSKAKTISE